MFAASRRIHQDTLRTSMMPTTSVSSFAPRAGEALNLSSSLILNDGHHMPRFGLGTWEMSGSSTITALRSAVEEIGYVHLDTAQYYRNEQYVGRFAKSTTAIQRPDLFLTTKSFTKGAAIYDSILGSLAKSELDYWDLVLIHAPDGGKDARTAAWHALSKLVNQGRVRSIGVSNYGERHITELLEIQGGVRPVTNQIECHPFFAQRELRSFCEKNNIVVQAYCPLARGRYFSNPTLVSVAQRRKKTVAQVMLRWSVQSGMVPLPKSSNPERQQENADVLSGWELSEQDMLDLDTLDQGSSGSIEFQSMSQEAP